MLRFGPGGWIDPWAATGRQRKRTGAALLPLGCPCGPGGGQPALAHDRARGRVRLRGGSGLGWGGALRAERRPGWGGATRDKTERWRSRALHYLARRVWDGGDEGTAPEAHLIRPWRGQFPGEMAACGVWPGGTGREYAQQTGSYLWRGRPEVSQHLAWLRPLRAQGATEPRSEDHGGGAALGMARRDSGRHRPWSCWLGPAPWDCSWALPVLLFGPRGRTGPRAAAGRQRKRTGAAHLPLGCPCGPGGGQPALANDQAHGRVCLCGGSGLGRGGALRAERRPGW
ncbi:hypothetical protein NDU88_003534 [Pleurodeles waltl]|uniref:Uncharacterized protein n=1 Tax=Pleurodeles waltl TaxID=8319 RepID=A0AAV7MQU1_PLEWA|nr:hypothetical protein NDU88_003534 [Pleurodeles waltl]